MNLLKIKQYKGVIWFSALKYLEIVVTAITTFIVAKKLGPTEMGLAMPIFLYITYANYLALGVNQVITKNLSRFKNEIKVRNMVTINLQILLLVSVVNLTLAFFLLDINLFYIVAGISICIIFRGFFASYFRAIFRIKILNKNNLIFSILLLCSVLFYVTTLKEYLIVWMLCLLVALVLYFLDAKKFFLKVFNNLILKPSKVELKYNLKEGIKLGITGLITTLLITSDRLIINKIDIPLEIKGSYQLADYFGTALYMVITTVVFYFYPKWIENLRNDNKFRLRYIKTLKSGLLIVPIVLILTYVGSILVIPFIFPEYQDLSTFILLSVYIKLSVIFLSMTSLYYIGMDNESKYIKSLLFLFSLLVVCSILFFNIDNIDFKWIPVMLGTLIFMEGIKKMISLTRNPMSPKYE